MTLEDELVRSSAAALRTGVGRGAQWRGAPYLKGSPEWRRRPYSFGLYSKHATAATLRLL